MVEEEILEALRSLRRVEKEVADAYWVEGGRVKDSDLERWAGLIYAARAILEEAAANHLTTREV